MLFEAAERTTTTDTPARTPDIVPRPAESAAMDKHLVSVDLYFAKNENDRQFIRANVNYSDTWKASEIAKIDADEAKEKPRMVESTLKAFDANLSSLVNKLASARDAAAADGLDTAKIRMYQSSLENGHLKIHGSVKKAVAAYNKAQPEFKRALQQAPDHVNAAFPQAAYQNDVMRFREKLAADLEAATEPEPVKLANAQLDMFMIEFGKRNGRVEKTLRWLVNEYQNSGQYDGLFAGGSERKRFEAIAAKAGVDDSGSYTELLFG